MGSQKTIGKSLKIKSDVYEKIQKNNKDGKSFNDLLDEQQEMINGINKIDSSNYKFILEEMNRKGYGGYNGNKYPDNK